MEFLVLSWEDIETGVLEIAHKMIEDSFKPEVIVGILTGGIIPAKLFADLLRVEELRVLKIRFYQKTGENLERPIIEHVYLNNIENKRVLLVDDVADTGKTLEVAMQAISLFYPSDIKIATLYIKPRTIIKPDYYYKTTEKWIVFPWDKWEILRDTGREEIIINKKFLEEYRTFNTKLDNMNK
jgi:hypoxanthine phosphoribosyltransferase